MNEQIAITDVSGVLIEIKTIDTQSNIKAAMTKPAPELHI